MKKDYYFVTSVPSHLSCNLFKTIKCVSNVDAKKNVE